MDQKHLESTGLTAAESKVYLMLLEQGASLAGVISRNTGIHRRSVYDAIERLVQKGLVSYIKQNNRKYFQAASPERFLEILKEKEENIKSVLPELKLLQQMSEGKNETLFFRGRTALSTVFDDQIEKEEDILVFGTTLKSFDYMKYYFPHYDRKRVEKKIKVKLILNEEDRDLYLKLKKISFGLSKVCLNIRRKHL